METLSNSPPAQQQPANDTNNAQNPNAQPTSNNSEDQQSTSVPRKSERNVITRASVRDKLGERETIPMSNIEEPDGLEGAARKARLQPFKLSEEEITMTSDFFTNEQTNTTIFELYLYVRNRILEQWFANPYVELKREVALEGVNENPKFKSANEDLKHIIFERCFNMLNRTGRINSGILPVTGIIPDYDRMSGPAKRMKIKHDKNFYQPPLENFEKSLGRIVVIGAGLSGLTATRHLKRMGFEVITLEARNRCGGRVQTYRRHGVHADLGPSTLNGVVGNPLVVMGKQLKLNVMELNQKIPIYESKTEKTGVMVCHRIDNLLERAVEREYNKIMEGTKVMKSNYRFENHHGKPISVGQAVDWVMRLQEKNIKDEQVKYLRELENYYDQLTENAEKKLQKSRLIKNLHGQLCSIKDTTDIGNHNDKGAIDSFERRALARDLDIALKEYKLLEKQDQAIQKKISNLTKDPPSDEYLSISDIRVLDWHFAELEYALGTPINQLDTHYDEDEDIFEGAHWMVTNGFNAYINGMAQDLDVRINTAVRKIKVLRNGVKITTYHPNEMNSPYKEITADAVLCTLPLGLLKDSIIPSKQAAADQDKPEPPSTGRKGYQPLIFSPPLPDWKVQAINRLGSGNLNKVILVFEKAFWTLDNHLFGVINHKAISRGEFFLFWHCGRAPVLTALCSGTSANSLENLSDLEIQERCQNLLKTIFGPAAVTTLKECIVTKWRRDPWSKGAWSFLQSGSTPLDYEACAEPVVLTKDEMSFHEDRISQDPDSNGQLKSKILIQSDSLPLVRRVRSEDAPRLFFAGEHTTRYHFASAHGAILTGLREATRMANVLLGCPYDDQDEGGVFVQAWE